MILKHIETFVCVYEECSMTRAAARLNIVQPAVSSQLRKLEAELKVTLFDRSPRGDMCRDGELSAFCERAGINRSTEERHVHIACGRGRR